LGCLRGYPGTYFPLGAGDYQSTSGAILRWCNQGELNTIWNDDDVRIALEDALGDGVFEIRLQFNENETNGDGNSDMVRFGTVTLKVTYTNP
jgi:hypothetical protein